MLRSPRRPFLGLIINILILYLSLAYSDSAELKDGRPSCTLRASVIVTLA